ncbi:GNAT family N-acetyltransferase [Streptomyces sp. TLI_105]|uniref:GNAT family N-acetyltransferase n=1 Tax=Streptomyces sp. TLI_105 TaxID=1881019 RepID=UPI00089B635D|nr:GNAT family N-acetyltransferase [Streptomyces sp. TLI_105]SEE22598.1 Ribosomal protein S18 acetylase RimI [Streptomyces sp. TLI_105]
MSDHTDGRPRIRDAVAGDRSAIWPFWHEIVAAGETYAWDQDTDGQAARALWTAPGSRVFVVETDPATEAGPAAGAGAAAGAGPATGTGAGAAGAIVASASVRPHHGGPARGVANAGFMVDPAHADRGIDPLAEHVLDEARRDGYTATVFNAVVETNPALRLWRSLGFTVLGTVPEAYDHPRRGPVGLHILHRRL